MELFCIVYYICSYIAGIPAIVKLIKTKKSNDYSLAEAIITIVGTTSWTIYIFSTIQSIWVYAGTLLDQVMVLVWDGLIIKYFKKEQ